MNIRQKDLTWRHTLKEQLHPHTCATTSGWLIISLWNCYILYISETVFGMCALLTVHCRKRPPHRLCIKYSYYFVQVYQLSGLFSIKSMWWIEELQLNTWWRTIWNKLQWKQVKWTCQTDPSSYKETNWASYDVHLLMTLSAEHAAHETGQLWMT